MLLRLLSAPLLFTPGLIQKLKNDYAFEDQRENCVKVVSEGYSIPPETVHRLLSGEIEFVVEGEDVLFEDPNLTETELTQFREEMETPKDHYNPLKRLD